VFPCIPEILGNPETPEILPILHHHQALEHQQDPGSPEIPGGLGNPENPEHHNYQQVPEFPYIPVTLGNLETLDILGILHHHQVLEHQQAPGNPEIQ